MHTLIRIRPSMTLAEVAESLGGTVEGASDAVITSVAPIDEAGEGHLTFLANKRYLPKLAACSASAVLMAPNETAEVSVPVVRVPNPYLAFAQAMGLFFAFRKHTPGVHPTAVVPESCTVDATAEIGPYVVLGEHVTVGANAVLHPHVVVYEHSTIGAGSVIHSHAVIREHSELGERVVIHNGSVIGADGFGFAPRGDGTYEKILQAGTVRLGDDVEIQANACVDRAGVGVTSIEAGTKVDNLVQVGHGCRIGKDNIICGQVALAGSTVIGNNTMLAGQVGVAGHLTIGDGAQVAAQAGVVSDLEAGGQYGGVPALPMKVTRMNYMQFTRLAEWVKKLRAMGKRVDKLEAASTVDEEA